MQWTNRCAGLPFESRTRRTFSQVGSSHLASAPRMKGEANNAEARNLLLLILLSFTNSTVRISELDLPGEANAQTLFGNQRRQSLKQTLFIRQMHQFPIGFEESEAFPVSRSIANTRVGQ